MLTGRVTVPGVDEEANLIEGRERTVEDVLETTCARDAAAVAGAYVSLMGPRERFEEMLEAYEAEGTTFEESELDSLYTPIGLDLGGGSPYQIAHSIVGEALAVSNDRTPRHLREREGHIHDRVDVDAPPSA